MSYGIDTIKVGMNVERSKMNLKGWVRTSQNVKTKNDNDDLLDGIVLSDCYQKVCKATNGAAITLRYVQRNYKKEQFEMLFVEFSVPKLVFGCNYRDLGDWDDAFEIVNEELSKILFFTAFQDVRTMELFRIDLCANLQVGEENVRGYLRALQKATHPHRELHAHSNSVSFLSKEISTTAYDKYQECKSEEARGILKYEIQIRNRWKISDWTGKRGTILADISKEMVRDLLMKDMQILGLDLPIQGDQSQVEKILSDTYSKCQTRSLIGYLTQRRGRTVKEMKEDGECEKTLRRYEKLLRQAGVSSLSIDEKMTLPVLTLMLDAEKGENVLKVPSATRTLPNQIQKGEEENVEETWSRGGEYLQAQGWLVGGSSSGPGTSCQQVLQDTTGRLGLVAGNAQSNTRRFDADRCPEITQRVPGSMVGFNSEISENQNFLAVYADSA